MAMAFRARPVPNFAPRRRVVVTGMGCVTSLGVTSELTWAGLLQNRSACGPLSAAPHFVASYVTEEKRKAILDALPCKAACYVTTPPSLLGPKGQDPFAPTSSEPRYTRFAKHAANEALQAAGLSFAKRTDDPPAARRIGVNIGVGMSSLTDVAEVGHHLYDPSAPDSTRYNKISPYFVPKILANMASGAVAIEHGLRGPNLATVTACATGGHCIGDSARLIQLGMADAMVCGATEAAINAIGIAGFARMRALSTKHNDEPHLASRPFDTGRDGFVMGEGAGVLVLEAEEHAVARGAHIIAEFRGSGASGDASHITSPRDDGSGARQAMAEALRDGGIRAGELGYVNAHATSTPLGDGIELAALESLLKEDGAASGDGHLLRVSSNKGHFGHLLGAAGAVEAIATILAIKHGIAPPTCNLEAPIAHDESRIHLVRSVPYHFGEKGLDAALSTSFGFGGTNAAVAFTRW